MQDLNRVPRLDPLVFPDNSLDVVTNVVSVDYLTRPLEVLQDVFRALRSGGIVIFSFSNRMFWTKAVRIWTESSEWQRVLICAAYFSLTGFEAIEAFEIGGTGGGGRGDPLYIVQARKPITSTASHHDSDSDKVSAEL